ncbi:hypothetical protein HanPI659440_Chr08g0305221 [Helianthus annuus]|nr:hypothetical protein HanPI659440_Chr08g0305221 [Helianthus annuus]
MVVFVWFQTPGLGVGFASGGAGGIVAVEVVVVVEVVVDLVVVDCLQCFGLDEKSERMSPTFG